MKNSNFDWPDAWIFTSLYYSIKDGEPFDLSAIIGMADLLNHSVPSRKEILDGLIKLQKYGLIKIYNHKLIYTDLGKKIIELAENKKGGQFSRVDITHKTLNSSKITFEELNNHEIDDLNFINENYYQESYNKYSKRVGNINNKKE